MKILYVGFARTIWGFYLNLMNPKGLSLEGVIEGIAKRYRFAKSPKNILDVDEQKGLPFKAGTFVNAKGTPLLINFTIHNDGLVVDTTSSTSDSTDFLIDLADWLDKEHHLTLPPRVRRGYVSQMDVECDIPLINLNPKLAQLLKFVDSRVKSLDGQSRQFDVSGLSFWTEDVTKTGSPTVVKFERKIPAPFSENHYFSQSPLETNDHIELLNELEGL